MPPLILTIANQKGGCGKTTTVMNLAGGLWKAKYRVLVVDADPQLSAMQWSLVRGREDLPFNVFTVKQAGGMIATLRQLDYDLILIDTPPGVADSIDPAITFARSAIRDADAVLVPLRPSPADFAASRQLVRFLATAWNLESKLAVLINARKQNALGNQARDQAAQLFSSLPGVTILESTIGDRTAIVEVTGSGETIFEYQPKHKAAFEYEALTKEVISWLRSLHC